MCKNARETAASLMTALKPDVVAILNLAGISSTTPPGSIVLSAYSSAASDLANWQSGTTAQNVLEALGDFQTAFSALPIPAAISAPESVIEAAIVTIIGIVTANSPAPAPASPVAASHALEGHDVQAIHAASVAADTEAQVKVLLPGFKRSIFHSPVSQYNKAWDQAADESGHPELKKAA